MAQRDAKRAAQLIIDGFIDYRIKFQLMTRQAPVHFARADWDAIQSLAAERIDLYDAMIGQVTKGISALPDNQATSAGFWARTKIAYIALIRQRSDCELGETFYNSVYCRLMQHLRVNDAEMFIRSQVRSDVNEYRHRIYRSYELNNGVAPCLKQLLNDFSFKIAWANPRRDIRNLMRFIRQVMSADLVAENNTRIEVIRAPFFRNKAAYIVGRVNFEKHTVPFILAVLNNEAGGIYVDTALIEENEVSIVFSFTRAYFMVDVDMPGELIEFLQSLMPQKPVAELYNSIGFYKQGKTEFYRAFIDHLEHSEDSFEIAAGTPGMVMTVFTLASYPIVFKLIRDRFSSSKQITRAGVIEKYHLVKHHDKAGRMADTQEFINLILPRCRFSDALLKALRSEASASVEILEDEVIIRHLWIERRMTPLNIHLDKLLKEADEQAIFQVIDEYGKCIKELAAANIFAGDMLFKNFGVTRHGRVVFYDYDEIVYLSDCNFREIPEPMYPEQEMADEPWYSIAVNDVFPEEFTMLTACDRRIRSIFETLHHDLLSAEWWRMIQQQVNEGKVIDLFPYRENRRFDQ